MSISTQRYLPLRGRRTALAFATAMVACSAQAFDLNAETPGLRIRWDNTLKYSGAFRLESPSATLTRSPNPNFDDGDRNLDSGLISNRIDLLSEFDATYGDFGIRFSGAAWYDEVYNSGTDNDSPTTYNAYSVPYTRFTNDTRDLHGRKAELLDALLFGKLALGDTTLRFRGGRFTQLWGESLFFGDNGIAGTRSPTDLIKLLSVPGSQFKELIRPIGQVALDLQLTPNLALGGYYQLEWQSNRIPASGSYFSRADLLGEGGERLVAGPPIIAGGGPRAFFRADDMEPDGEGQYGMQLRWRSDALDTDFGVYAVRYHEKNFITHLYPGVGANVQTGQIGAYSLVYPKNIEAYGVSFARGVGPASITGEISTRRGTPLVAHGGSVVVAPGTIADNDDHPLYPVGNSLHAQVSTVLSLGRSAWWDGSLLLAEVAFNRRLSVDKNPQNLETNATRDAYAMRAIFMPTWYQVMSGIDLTVPVGVGYNPSGRSSVITLWNGGWSEGGDLSIGLSADYLQTWKAAISFTHYYGSEGTVLDGTNSFSFKQSLQDRDFVSLTVQRTF